MMKVKLLEPKIQRVIRLFNMQEDPELIFIENPQNTQAQWAHNKRNKEENTYKSNLYCWGLHNLL